MLVECPHNRYFREVMKIPQIAKQFFAWFLPSHLRAILDLDSLSIVDGSYVDSPLHETISDVVFDCRYKLKGELGRKYGGEFYQTKIVVLFAHQSIPERFMPIKVYNYLFNLFDNHLQHQPTARGNDLLPAVYPIVIYRGHSKEYPYSMNVLDCVQSPVGIMHSLSQLEVQLINVNELSQKIIIEHGLSGIVVDALRHVSDEHMAANYLSIFQRMGKLARFSFFPASFVELTLRYMIEVKSVPNVNELIEKNRTLPTNIRSEIMTIAEQYEARGEARGEKRGIVKGEAIGEVKGKIVVAINLLKEGIDKSLIAKTTTLDMSKIDELSELMN